MTEVLILLAVCGASDYTIELSVARRALPEAKRQAVIDECNRVWGQAGIEFVWRIDSKQKPRIRFDYRSDKWAGWSIGGDIKVDSSGLDPVCLGRLVAHELGHYLGLHNIDIDSRLMGQLDKPNHKSGTYLTEKEIETARRHAAKLGKQTSSRRK